ncbi:MAG: Antitoxin MazE [bacterium]|nr:Antitoxin MazE [bacterium]
MHAKLQKWGNSLGLRIPKAFADEVGIGPGSTVDLALEEGRLSIRPIQEASIRLEELLSRVTEDNLHSEIDFGAPAGCEIW